MNLLRRAILGVTTMLVPLLSAGGEPVCQRTVLFEAGQQGYFTYRIASMVATKQGSLLAFAAARRGKGGDWDPINIVQRRSTDAGKTWSPLQVVVADGDRPCDNAMPITDYLTGEVHLLYQIGYARCYYTKSQDDGLTWSKPVDLTATIDTFKKIYPWVVQAPGPGHGIQMTNGRLVVPFWLSDGGGKDPGTGRFAHRPSIVVSVYSDDHGRTWQAGDVAVPDNDVTVIPNETSVIQLADGRVLFNSRNESPNYRRLFTTSRDGATGWSQPYFHDAFFEPICFGSMVRHSLQPAQSKHRILFCNPDSRHDPWIAAKPSHPRSARNRHRTNLTLRLSYDEGHTWPVAKVIDPGIAGYSDLAVTPDGMIHILYEGGTIPGWDNSHFKNQAMSVVSLNLEWLTDGADRLAPGDQPLNRLVRP
jgi:sialidase-1